MNGGSLCVERKNATGAMTPSMAPKRWDDDD
jgi:hypothetical protein